MAQIHLSCNQLAAATRATCTVGWMVYRLWWWSVFAPQHVKSNSDTSADLAKTT